MGATKGATRSIYLDTASAQTAAKQLTDQVDKLDAAIVKGTKAGKDVTAQMQKLGETKSKLQEVNDVLAKGMAPSLRELEKTTVKLRQELRGMAADSSGFKTKIAEYNKANAQLSEMRLKVQGVKSAQDSFGGKFLSFLSNVSPVGIALAVLTAGIKLITGSIEEATAAEKSLSRLHNTLNNIGRGDAFDRITKKADDLANTFKYLDNDDITEVFQQLISYGKLTEGQMNDLLPVIINFAAKSGISVNESASVIIKALEGNGKALKEYGISIKDGETVTERLGIVMTDLKGKVDGAATAFGETFPGQVAIAKQRISNLQEEIGNKLLPILVKVFTYVNKAMDSISIGFNFTKSIFSSIKENGLVNGFVLGSFQTAGKGYMDEYKKEVASIAKSLTSTTFKTIEEKTKFIDSLDSKITSLEKQIQSAKNKKDLDLAIRLETTVDAYKLASKNLKNDIALSKGPKLGSGEKEDDNKTPKTKTGKSPIDQAAIDAKKAAEELARLRAEMRKLEEELGLNTLSQYERDLAKLGNTYDEFLKKLQSNGAATNDDFTRLAIDRNIAIDQLNDKYLKDLQTFLDERNGKTTKANKTAYENDVDAVNKSFDAQDKTYKGNTEALKKLAIQRATELNDLMAKLESGGYSDVSQVGLGSDKKDQATLEDKVTANLNTYLSYASQVIDILGTINAARDRAERTALDKELKGFDEKRNGTKKLLDSKVISEQEYRRRVAAIDAEAENKRRDLEMKQWERNKKLQVAQALVNGALGVTAVLAARPGPLDLASLGIFRAINIGLTIAATAAQVVAINKSKPSFARGGFLTGPSHSKGGMPVINPTTGRKEAEVEGGEVILSRNTVRNNPSAVNSLLFASMYRNGATVNAPWNTRDYKSINFTGINRRYSKGGHFADGGVFKSQDTGFSSDDLKKYFQNNENVLLSLLEQMKKPNIAIITQKSINEASLQQQRIFNDAALK